jgi:hypothetical protein
MRRGSCGADIVHNAVCETITVFKAGFSFIDFGKQVRQSISGILISERIINIGKFHRRDKSLQAIISENEIIFAVADLSSER